MSGREAAEASGHVTRRRENPVPDVQARKYTVLCTRCQVDRMIYHYLAASASYLLKAVPLTLLRYIACAP